MCLAVPGEIVSVDGVDPLSRTGQVRFGAVEKEVSLAFVPEAKKGNYVLVHAGIAIAIVEEAAAAETVRVLKELEA